MIKQNNWLSIIKKLIQENYPGLRYRLQFTIQSANVEEFTEDTIKRVLQLSNKEYIKGLSILGGEPMHPNNIEGTTKLAKAFKEEYPDKTIWVWSGYRFDEDLKDKEVLKYIDVLVDGQYADELHNPTLSWRGSENQRVIDVQKSLKNGEVTVWEDAS